MLLYYQDIEDDDDGPDPTTPTELNVWALARHFAGLERQANRVTSTRAPHIRRCLRAGLVVAEGRELVLTDAGRSAIKALPEFAE